MSRGVMAEHQFSDADDSDGGEEDGDEVDDDDDEEDDYDGDSTPKTRSRSTSPQPYGLPAMSITAVASSHPAPHLSHPSASDLLGNANKPPLFGYFTTVPSIQITPQAPPSDPAGRERADGQRVAPRAPGIRLLVPGSSSSMDEDLPVPSPDLSSPSSRLSSPGLDLAGCPSPISPSSSPAAQRYLSPRRDLSPHAGHLSPRRDISPLRHISPKRDLGVAGGYRRDLSPRRGHLSLLSPLSRPTSPAGRDYKRDHSPRGRHRGMIRPVSPRRGLHQHLHHQSQQSGSRGLRPAHQTGLLAQAELDPLGRRRGSAEMETEHRPGSPSSGEQDQGGNRGNPSSPPHQVLFSHLPLHSQLQVRSPFPMIPIGGIQMVHSVPASVTSPLAQQEAQQVASRLLLQKSTSEDSTTGEAAPAHFTSFAERGARGGGERARESTSPHPSSQERGGGGGGARQEQEESIHTCTKAIASLCIDSEELAERGGAGGAAGGGRASSCSSSPSALSPDSQQQHRSPSISMSPPSPHPSPSPPQGPGIQHFSGLELRPPYPSIPASPHCSSSACPSPSSSSPSPHPPSPGSETLQPSAAASKPLKPERDWEAESTKRSKEVS